MIDYTRIFRKKQHYLTIPQIPAKKVFMNQRQVLRLLDKQEEDWDIFITKYPKDHCISTIILDFDDKENPENALKEAEHLKRYLNRKGLNMVIVNSGRKGNHGYIQIPCHNFVGGELAHAEADPNVFFKQYVKNLIGVFDGKSYNTLDEVNSSAGLNGNIRLIGSIHPKSGNLCEIIDGEFLSEVPANDWDYKCFEIAKNYAEDKVTVFKRTHKISQENDLIEENDLQDIFESLGAKVNRYNGYSYATCLFHNDEHPSCFVDKYKFFCQSCGAKGNIYTLLKTGLLKLDNDVRVGGAK